MRFLLSLTGLVEFRHIDFLEFNPQVEADAVNFEERILTDPVSNCLKRWTPTVAGLFRYT